MVYLRRALPRPSRTPSVKFASVSQKIALNQVYNLQYVFSAIEGARFRHPLVYLYFRGGQRRFLPHPAVAVPRHRGD